MDFDRSSAARTFLGVRKTAGSYLRIPGIRYTGASELDQSDEPRESFCKRCVPIWVSLYDLLSAYGFQDRYVYDPVPVLSCPGILYSYGIPCNAENVVQIEISAVCGNSDLYTGKLLGKTDVFQILFVSSSGIWNDFCDSIGVFSDPVFSDRKRTAENKRNKNYSWQFCTGIFINTGNPFLWNDDSGTLLHRYCDRVLHTFSEQGIFQTDYAYRYHQCVSGSITDGNCICRRHTDAGISWVGS